MPRRFWRVEELAVKFTSLFLCLAASVATIVAAPVTYDMTFTGGFFSDSLNREVPFAPSSGSFTYDPASGFSNFIVMYDGATFNFTAQANAPEICIAGSPCYSGTPADAFASLTTDSTWDSFETPIGYNTSTFLALAYSSGETFYQTVPVFEGFQECCGSPRMGTFAVAAAVPTPEPLLSPILVACLPVFAGLVARGRRGSAHPPGMPKI
jgi:hypothetical protein